MSAHSYAFLSCKRILHTYPGSGRPGIPAFKVDPANDVRNRQEFGDAGMCHHFRLRFSQDMHGHGVSKKASDNPFLKACLLSNLLKRDLTTRGYHIRDLVAADCVDADQVGDLEVLVHEHAHRTRGIPTDANLKSNARGSRSSSCSSAVASRTASLRWDTSGGRLSGLSSANDGVGAPWADKCS